ncbi:MAG: SLBB domain-containing protein [Gemmatimonadota bacterium]|nr:SLBB domain-containing protein [Gemmatimonadota bacterium]
MRTSWTTNTHRSAAVRKVGMLLRSCAAVLALGAFAACSHPKPMVLPPVSDTGPHATAASRAELTAAAVAAEQMAAAQGVTPAVRTAKLAEAAALRERLRDGDFRVGDRIVLVVDGQKIMSDTFVVQPKRRLSIPDIGEVSLDGVLRSELRGYMVTQIGRFIRNPSVQATGLIQLGVLGQVSRPGFYWISPDLLVSDAIMRAGGPTSTASLDGTLVIRESKPWLDAPTTTQAINGGRTLDQLNIRGGDQIMVGQHEGFDWERAARISSLITTIGFAIYAIAARR